MCPSLCRSRPWAKCWDPDLFFYFVLGHSSLPMGSRGSGEIVNDCLNLLLKKVQGAWTCHPLDLQSEKRKHIYTSQNFRGFAVSVSTEMRWASLVLGGEHMSKGGSLSVSFWRQTEYCPNACGLRKKEEADLKKWKKICKQAGEDWILFLLRNLPNVCSEEPGLILFSWEHLCFSEQTWLGKWTLAFDVEEFIQNGAIFSNVTVGRKRGFWVVGLPGPVKGPCVHRHILLLGNRAVKCLGQTLKPDTAGVGSRRGHLLHQYYVLWVIYLTSLCQLPYLWNEDKIVATS